MRRIKTAVIPAAGHGKRIMEIPFTRILPKPMLPVMEKPIIEYGLENLIKMGVEDVIIIIGKKGDIIRSYFEDGSDWNVSIRYIEQIELNGISGAIQLAEEYIDQEFVVILGDDLTISDTIASIPDYFHEKKATAVECVVHESDSNAISRTCSVTLRADNSIEKIIEKPENPDSMMRGTGLYMFSPEIFEYIQKTPPSSRTHQKEITETIGLISRERRAFAFEIDGLNININTRQDLHRAIESVQNSRRRE